MKQARSSIPVIAYKNLPAGFGITGLIAVWLLMDRLGAAPWGFVVFWIFAAYIVGSGLRRVWTTYGVDLFAPMCDCAQTGTAWLGDGEANEPDETIVRIDILRTHVDALKVTAYNAAGETLATFPAAHLALGEIMSLREICVRTERTYQ